MTWKFRRHALLLALAGTLAFSQESSKKQEPKVETQEPPEEDTINAPKEYSFNPLQAAKEMKIGEFYFKKKNYRAASNRFEEATKWNPGFGEAYFRLAEAKEKLHDKQAAVAAYKKYLEVEPDGKDAAAAKKKLDSK